MKTIIAAAMLLLSSSWALAQNDAISKFFDKYAEDESFTQVTVTAKMFSLFADLDLENEQDKELADAVSRVKGLRVLSKDNINQEEARALYKEALSKVPVKEYEELMSVRDNETNMKFLIKEKDGIINELFMVMHGNNEFVLLSLVGEIDLKQISRLSKTIQVHGFEHLEKVEEQEQNKN